MSLIASQWTFHQVRAQHKLALSLGQQLEQIGEAQNDVATQSLGHLLHGASCFLLGEFAAARTLLERSMGGLANPQHRTFWRLSFNPYSAMLPYLALTLAQLGYIDQARSRMDEALSAASQLGHIHILTLSHVLVFANRLQWLIGLPMMHIEQLLTLATKHGFPFYLSSAQAYRGRSCIVLGQVSEGLSLLTQALAGTRATGGVVSTPILFTWLAEAHAMLGQPAEARDYLAEAVRIVETTGERFFEAELLYRVPGDLLNAAGDQSAAEQHYCRAIGVAEQQGAKLFQLRASTSLARLWRDQGKRAEARDLLGPIYTWFTEGFDAPDLKDAKALLDELTS